MTRFQVVALLGALLLHAGVLLFGGLLLPKVKGSMDEPEDVALVAETEPEKPEDAAKKEEKTEAEERQDSEERPEIAEPAEPMPDLQPLAALESAAAGPALDALSLSDLESALNPGEGSGGFGQGFSLTSGGRIGAAGGPAGGLMLEEIASIGDLDQRPQPIAQSAPMYPAELRRRRVEGTVSVVFLVDTEGRVTNPTVEKSTDPAFERAALEAVRRWRFEPGTRLGHKVQFKMRVPITFRAG
jgi:protein TonB